uniref:Uncharacterized protein n=1 Tax=Aggregatibacter actinomycetemcomitans TaxID=714 RepID=S4WCN4_AGGAC|nr:hypothetical protein pS23A_0044 [Aggregatibacter actinomycetemcomitans]
MSEFIQLCHEKRHQHSFTGTGLPEYCGIPQPFFASVINTGCALMKVKIVRLTVWRFQ